jgi:adenine-specific DNA-methyltransferase
MATKQPEKLTGTSLDISAENCAHLKALFPTVFAETKNDKGELVESIDFEKLKSELGTFSDVFESRRERYGMDWPGKKEALRLIQTPSAATLKPCREESVNFDTTENLFIEGDNLEVLKLLQKSYYGKVKMIYIDPPYNTGKEFIYPDNYTESLETYLEYAGLIDGEGKKFSTNTANEGRFHTKWLNMMYPRLYLARNLLRDDGVIFISIDENEQQNLRKLGDEVFGESNYAGELIWKNSSKNDQDYIAIQHEYILVWVKNKLTNIGDWVEVKEGLQEIYTVFDQFRAKHGQNWEAIHKEALEWYGQFPEINPIYASKHYNWMDERGVYFASDISGPNYGQYRYDVIHPTTKQSCKEPASGWRYPPDTMKDRIGQNLVHFGIDHTTVPCNKTYLKDTEKQSLTSLKVRDGRGASNRLKDIFKAKVFTNPKDEYLLAEILNAVGIKGDDIVLDFFAGSGATFHSVLLHNIANKCNCKAILVQLPEDLIRMRESATGSAKQTIENAIEYLTAKARNLTVSEICKERLKLTAQKIKTEEPILSSSIDLDFKVLKLDKSNFRQWQQLDPSTPPEKVEEELFKHIEHISDKATPEDLLYEILLKAGFTPTEKIETKVIAGKNVFSIAIGALLLCLEDEVTKELINAVAELEPMQFICLDGAFHGNDQLKANAVQTFAARNMQKEKHNQIIFKTV